MNQTPARHQGKTPAPRRRLTTLAEVVASLQDRCENDRQVVRALRCLLAQGHLRRLTPRVSRAA